jgi:hypothetical protein
VEAGQTVSFEISMVKFEPDSVFYLAMRAADRNNLTSAISNPFQFRDRFYKIPFRPKNFPDKF